MIHQIALDPGHDQLGQSIHLGIGQSPAARDAVPALDAPPAAGGRGMLSSEDRMPAVGGLLAVLQRVGRPHTLGQHLVGVAVDGIPALGAGVGAVLGRKGETGPEARMPQSGKRVLNPGLICPGRR